MEILIATSSDMPVVAEIFREYQQWLDVDLCFQDFDSELASLPGRYSAPRGTILIAREGDNIIGCVGIRPADKNDAELKRLYVKPDFHGRGIGRLLFEQAMTMARETGYSGIVLDTLPSMKRAHKLYRDYGFQQIPAYYSNPEPGAQYYRYEFAK